MNVQDLLYDLPNLTVGYRSVDFYRSSVCAVNSSRFVLQGGSSMRAMNPF